MADTSPRPFSYSVVRLVPDIERGERLNAGVILFCPSLDFLGARVELDDDRVLALAAGRELDLDAARRHLQAIERIAGGDPGGGPIARLDPSARFHWLVAPSSTIVQPSVVHTGLCDDPAACLDDLFGRLVR